MTTFLAPGIRWKINRILPHILIWVITGWVFLLVESAATGNENLRPSTAITLTLPVFIFASLAIAIVGAMVGLIEVVVMDNLFIQTTPRKKILLKFLIYLVLIFVVIFLTFVIAASIELDTTIIDDMVWQKLGRFLGSVTFLSTILQISFSLLLSLLYAAVSENIGHNVLRNLFTGKYHQPLTETRIFMFLDMKSSTTIAEELGHVKYFQLLRSYYQVMSEPIINHEGEVYQYIGDEVVVSWDVKGLVNNNCLGCFYEIKRKMRGMEDYFMRKYGVYPDFKAGMHIGEVTTGEIGALKKEIFFTGDVLNTTARLQGLCKKYDADLLISGNLKELLPSVVFRYFGTELLQGKKNALKVFGPADHEFS